MVTFSEKRSDNIAIIERCLPFMLLISVFLNVNYLDTVFYLPAFLSVFYPSSFCELVGFFPID